MAIGSNPYSLAGVYRVSLYFSGTEFPFSKESHLGILHMAESSKLEIPMIRLQITDGIKFFKKNPSLLVEGCQLRVSLVARDVADAEYTFRVNSIKNTPCATGDVIDIDGYLDCPKFWVETTNLTYANKTSNDVLAEVAGYAGLKYEGTVTADSQTWHGSKKRVHAFCSNVANHGYASQTSCMKLAVCLDGTMRYKDVAMLDTGSPVAKFIIGDIKQGYLTVVSHAPKNSGGSANRKAGYRQTHTEYSVYRADLYRNHTNLMADINEGGEFNMNSDVRGAVTSGAHIVSPIDYGNVHDDYHRASYQNKRGTALFNVGLDILTNMPAISKPKVRVFDTVSVTAPAALSEQNGLYVVVSHTIAITSGQHHEKFELTRRSAASDQSRSVASAKSFESTGTDLYKDEA